MDCLRRMNIVKIHEELFGGKEKKTALLPPVWSSVFLVFFAMQLCSLVLILVQVFKKFQLNLLFPNREKLTFIFLLALFKYLL